MPPRKPSSPEPYPINPQCAATMATITERLTALAETQAHTTETIFGNTKPGLKADTAENTRAIASLTKLVEAIAEAHKQEQEARLRDAQAYARTLEDAEKRHKRDRRNFWFGILAAAIIAVITIVQDVATQAALNRMLAK